MDNTGVVFTPANCTSELQPLDVSVNEPLKDHLRTKFTHWYADKVSAQLVHGIGTSIEAIKIDMSMSVIKPSVLSGFCLHMTVFVLLLILQIHVMACVKLALLMP